VGLGRKKVARKIGATSKIVNLVVNAVLAAHDANHRQAIVKPR